MAKTTTAPDTTTGGATPVKQTRGIAPKQIIATVLVVLAIVLCFENSNSVPIQLVGPTVTSPLWILVIIPLVLGLAAGFLFGHKGRKK